MSAQTNTWLEPVNEQADHIQQPQKPAFNWAAQLPNLLRILGAAALIIGMYSFLVKGWQNGNDVLRYLLLLGHTTVLVAVGLASSRWLKENKSARLLLTLALVSVPANFAILGAFIYSQTGDINATQYPQYVAWVVDSWNTAILTSAGAMLVLIPVTLLGFTVLLRGMSRRLTVLFLLSNTMLLMPLRDPQLIAALALVMICGVIVLSRKMSRDNTAAKTQEGVTALSLQLLPLAVLMGRSLWLYSTEMFLLTVLAVTSFLVMRQVSSYFSADSGIYKITNFLSLIPAAFVMPLLSDTLAQLPGIPAELSSPLAALATGFMIYDVSRRSTFSNGYRRIAVAVPILALAANILVFNSLLAAGISLLIGAVLTVYGYKVQQRSVFVGGVLAILTGMLHQLYQMTHYFDMGNWATLAIAGILAIVIASIIESKGLNLKNRFRHIKTQFNEWEK